MHVWAPPPEICTFSMPRFVLNCNPGGFKLCRWAFLCKFQVHFCLFVPAKELNVLWLHASITFSSFRPDNWDNLDPHCQEDYACSLTKSVLVLASTFVLFSLDNRKFFSFPAKSNDMVWVFQMNHTNDRQGGKVKPYGQWSSDIFPIWQSQTIWSYGQEEFSPHGKVKQYCHSLPALLPSPCVHHWPSLTSTVLKGLVLLVILVILVILAILVILVILAILRHHFLSSSMKGWVWLATFLPLRLDQGLCDSLTWTKSKWIHIKINTFDHVHLEFVFTANSQWYISMRSTARVCLGNQQMEHVQSSRS